MQFDQLKEYLYTIYYKDGNRSSRFSDVTSSHWRDFGEKTSVIRENDEFIINSYGISGFSQKTFVRNLKNIPKNYLLSRLLNKYKANEETVRCAKLISEKLNIVFNFDHAKHILIFDLLESHGIFETENLICIIGDGHGFLGTLIKAMRPDAKILFINLGRNLLIDVVCFSVFFPDINPLHISNIEDHKAISSHSIMFLEAENYNLLGNLPVRLFVNIASMQEMEMPVINKYFEIMETSTVESYFYCCNREEKVLSDSSIIGFMDYPWGGGQILVDEPCPWYQEYPSSRPPFWKPFDGTHLHRLIKLETK